MQIFQTKQNKIKQNLVKENPHIYVINCITDIKCINDIKIKSVDKIGHCNFSDIMSKQQTNLMRFPY